MSRLMSKPKALCLGWFLYFFFTAVLETEHWFFSMREKCSLTNVRHNLCPQFACDTRSPVAQIGLKLTR